MVAPETGNAKLGVYPFERSKRGFPLGLGFGGAATATCALIIKAIAATKAASARPNM